MSALQNITSHLTRDDFAKTPLYFHTNNKNNNVDITKKTDEEIAKLFLSKDRDINAFLNDFVFIKKLLEEKGLQCTQATRLSLAQELWLSDYEIGRMEYGSRNNASAAEYYKNAVDADVTQEHPDMIIEYANLLIVMQNHTEAEKIYELVIKGSSKEWWFIASNKLANLYFNQRRYEDAETCYLEATTSENIATKQEAHANLAALYKQVMEWKIQL